MYIIVVRTWPANINKKFLIAKKTPAIDPLSTPSKKAIQKIAEATGDLIGNNIPDRINGNASQSASDGTSESTNTAQTDEPSVGVSTGMPKERYKLPEIWQQIIDKELKLLKTDIQI